MQKLLDNLYKIAIPFDGIYTSSFIIIAGDKTILYDCGFNAYDVETYIIPALKELDKTPDMIVASHDHGDHFGGIERVVEEYPGIEIIGFSSAIKNARIPKDREKILDRFMCVNLPGHSDDCLGLVDMSTNTMLSGDSLQMFGVGKYGTLIRNKKKYFESIEIARSLKLNRIVASHDFYPLGFMAEGEKVNEFLDKCKYAIDFAVDFFKSHNELSLREAMQLYNNTLNLPTVYYEHVINWM